MSELPAGAVTATGEQAMDQWVVSWVGIPGTEAGQFGLGTYGPFNGREEAQIFCDQMKQQVKDGGTSKTNKFYVRPEVPIL